MCEMGTSPFEAIQGFFEMPSHSSLQGHSAMLCAVILQLLMRSEYTRSGRALVLPTLLRWAKTVCPDPSQISAIRLQDDPSICVDDFVPPVTLESLVSTLLELFERSVPILELPQLPEPLAPPQPPATLATHPVPPGTLVPLQDLPVLPLTPLLAPPETLVPLASVATPRVSPETLMLLAPVSSPPAPVQVPTPAFVPETLVPLAPLAPLQDSPVQLPATLASPPVPPEKLVPLAQL